MGVDIDWTSACPKNKLQAMSKFGVYAEVGVWDGDRDAYANALPKLWVNRQGALK